MSDLEHGKIQFARDQIALAEDRMRSLADSFHGWNVGRILRSWADNALRPAREALDTLLQP